MSDLLTSQELSERLKMSEGTIRRLKAQNKIPYVQPVPGGAIRYDYDAVVRAMKRETKRQQKEKGDQTPQG